MNVIFQCKYESRHTLNVNVNVNDISMAARTHLHVLDRINRHPGHTHVTGDTRVVGVVPEEEGEERKERKGRRGMEGEEHLY